MFMSVINIKIKSFFVKKKNSIKKIIYVDLLFNTLTAAAIFRKLAKRLQVDFFYMSENEITRSFARWKRTQSTSYLVFWQSTC